MVELAGLMALLVSLSIAQISYSLSLRSENLTVVGDPAIIGIPGTGVSTVDALGTPVHTHIIITYEGLSMMLANLHMTCVSQSSSSSSLSIPVFTLSWPCLAEGLARLSISFSASALINGTLYRMEYLDVPAYRNCTPEARPESECVSVCEGVRV